MLLNNGRRRLVWEGVPVKMILLLGIFYVVWRFAFLPVFYNFYNNTLQFVVIIWFDKETLDRS